MPALERLARPAAGHAASMRFIDWFIGTMPICQ